VPSVLSLNRVSNIRPRSAQANSAPQRKKKAPPERGVELAQNFSRGYCVGAGGCSDFFWRTSFTFSIILSASAR
jgi:hypothetical protein